MKKTFSIALLFLYLFSLTGYLLLQVYIESSDKKLIAQLDEHQYDHAELVEVKIPINLPYATDESEYQRMDGEVEFSGVFYNYVKRKISKDTLYILCLPNKSKTRIVATGNKLIKLVNDIPASKKDKDSSKKLNKSIEYLHKPHVYAYQITTIFLEKMIVESTDKLPILNVDVPVQPPEA